MGKIKHVRFSRAVPVGFHQMLDFLHQAQEVDNEPVFMSLDSDGRFLRLDFKNPTPEKTKRYQLIPLENVSAIFWEEAITNSK